MSTSRDNDSQNSDNLQNATSPVVNTSLDAAATKLVKAIEQGNVFLVKQLIAEGVPTDIIYKKKSLLMLAYDGGHFEILEMLLKTDAIKLINFQDAQGFTLVSAAVQDKNLEIVKLLTQNSANLNLPSDQNDCPLSFAIEDKDIVMIDYLVKNGADINISMGPENSSSLKQAIKTGNKQIVQFFIENLILNGNLKKTLYPDNGISPLHIAVITKNFDIADLLLNQGASIDQLKLSEGRTLAHQAASDGDKPLLKWCLKVGIPIDSEDDDGMRPIFIAIQNSHIQIADLLFQNGVSIEQQDQDKWRPLFVAIETQKEMMVSFLIQKGANITNPGGPDSETPLFRACWISHDSIVQLLLAKGAEKNINQPDNFDTTALICAAGNGDFEICKMLIESGADVNWTAKDGRTALGEAKVNRHIETIEYLTSLTDYQSQWSTEITKKVKYTAITSNEIGRGGFAIVYRGKYQGIEVAIKEVSLSQSYEDSFNSFKHEISFLELITQRYGKHNNLISYCGWGYQKLNPPTFFIVTEYSSRGSLAKWALDFTKYFPYLTRLILMKDMVVGLKALHDINILHLDVKLDNVLIFEIDNQPHAKLTDFGLSRAQEKSKIGKVGTTRYMAPEVRDFLAAPSRESDVYSWGSSCFELFQRKTLDKKATTQEQSSYLKGIDLKKACPPIQPAIISLLNDCTATKPKSRRSTNDCIFTLSEEIKAAETSKTKLKQ